MTDKAINAFAKNRAEELGFDLWGDFVVPPFFHKLALDEVRKPLLIEGGRGCGKTTLLRYLSHQTQLSPRRKLTSDSLPKQIGLYLRADTQFLRTFRGTAQDEENWQKIFEHALCLMILGELLAAVELLGAGADRKELFGDIHEINLPCLGDFGDNAPQEFSGARHWVRSQHNYLASWLQNSDSANRPRLLPLKPVLLAVITLLREQLPCLDEVVFFVFVDEYENLLGYQMKLINTLLKHSEPPLIFHVAAKRNGMSERSTIGSEQLQEPDDYRQVDIEELLADDFELFAAELFCFRLLKKGIRLKDSPVTVQMLCDEAQVTRRFTDTKYGDAVKGSVAAFLPGMSNEEIAAYVFKDSTLHEQLTKGIDKALANLDRSLNATEFMRARVPMASICVLALLNQGKRPRELLNELDELEAGKPSKFKTADWIHHYFLGTILYLYLPLQRPCIAYAGFSTFLKLSRCNVRHFLELCYVSMQSGEGSIEHGHVEVTDQAQAARIASALFVKETQGSGDFGNRLFLVVNTLGQIFRLSQQRPSQSEAERTHFAIVDGTLSEDAQDILRECIKWSVLIAVKETKVKDARLATNDYILNPIYAPYFGISYNKGRKLEISADFIDALLVGSRASLDQLVKSYKRQWDVVVSEQISLL